MVSCFIVIAAEWAYTFKSDEHTVNESESRTHMSELCSVVSPRLLHRYANRTVYETHLSILSNIESAMVLAASVSEHS